MPRGGDPLSPLWAAYRTLVGRRPTAEERHRFARYLELLLLWNRTHRLTALRSREAVVRGLFQDSLLFLPLLPGRRPIALVDIGAGAGIPGVPLHLVEPGIHPTLIEARRKRVSFLLALKRELDLEDLRVLEGRAEKIITEHPDLLEKFDVVVSRAVRSPGQLLRDGLRYLKPGGIFIASGPPADTPLPPITGSTRAAWRRVPYPALGLTRVFFVAEKG